MTTSIIRHIHLPDITPFSLVQTIQAHLVGQFLTHKALLSSASRAPSSPVPPAPTPTIVTFVPTPVYTTGRREHDILSPSQISLLKAPLSPLRPTSHNQHANPEWAAIVPTLRGGQTTFHGPGQLVIYPILDLKPASSPYTSWPRGLSVRCYVHLLEQSTINTLAHWKLTGIRTENPGVWEESEERKIAALGVHLRRNVTSFGVGLNVSTDLRWFDRIVACGLVGKGVVSMRDLGREMRLWDTRWRERSVQEGDEKSIVEAFHWNEEETVLEVERRPGNTAKTAETIKNIKLRARLKPSIVGRVWVREFAKGLYGEGGEERVQKVGIDDLELPEDFLMRFKSETGRRQIAWDEIEDR